MLAATKFAIRELDYRASAGIEVQLLWQEHGDHTWVRVRDARSEETFMFSVPPGDAPEAFRHPFAYAPAAEARGAAPPHAPPSHLLERSLA